MKHRRSVVLVGTGIIAIAAVTAALLVLRTPGTEVSARETLAVNTASVERGALVERVRANGVLAFSGRTELGTPLHGTLTSLAGVGSVIDRGAELFRIDDKPVVLMIGDLPGWRDFTADMENGRDVLQLEQNLAALGFFSREPDQDFTWVTSEAVRAWQKSVGLERTGELEAGRVVFVPSPVRVSGELLKPGDPAGAGVLSITGTDKVVTAFAPPELRAVVEVGASVRVTLPDGSATTGTVTAVGAPVEKENSSGGKSLKLPVTAALDDPAAADAYSDVNVNMELSRTLSEDALLVPVLALLAQPEGGFAVQVRRGSKTNLVPVEIGAFADGEVEVTSDKLSEGDKVVVGT